MQVVELVTTAVAAGGEAVARGADGRVVFVRGALPGERVLAGITEERSSFARAEVVEVLAAAPGRRKPPCRHVARGCGGCDWQHIEVQEQRNQRRSIVVEALQRIGGIADPLVGLGPDLPTTHYRTTLRCTVRSGRAGFRRRSSHEPIPVDDCLVAHPLLEELIIDGRFGAATEVTLRAGARTGERLVLASPTAAGIEVPDDVVVVGVDDLAAGRQAWIHEAVAGRTWRVSAESFFQASPDGAEALVAEVERILVSHPSEGPLLDLCAGVGLFAGALGSHRPVVAVEVSPSSVADARHNLADLDAQVVRSSFERWHPRPASVVVADPARAGLGRAGVGAIAATGASTLALVSCDPASLGRDARLLAEAGFAMTSAVVVDLFPQTAHVETVSGFVR